MHPPEMSIAGYELFRRATAASGPTRASATTCSITMSHAHRTRLSWRTTASRSLGCTAVGDCRRHGPPGPGQPRSSDQGWRSSQRGHRHALRADTNRATVRRVQPSPASSPSRAPASGLLDPRRRSLSRRRVARRPTGRARRTAGVSVVASDDGSGVRRLLVLVDGEAVADEPVDDRAGTCRDPYVVRRALSARRSTRSVAFDTTRHLRTELHVVEVAAEDAAGNQDVVSEGRRRRW